MTDLTKTNIDFDSIRDELEADLQNRDTFKSLFPGETSKVFVEQGAGIAALQLFHIHSAAQNAFMPTAFSKSAVYALASTLGNPPTRKLGAQLTLSVAVNTTLTSSVTLPKFSRFSGRGLEWYTIEDFVINPGDTVVSFQVRQGERTTETFPATGKDNQRIEIGEDFNIDENFLTVTVGTTEYTKNGFSLLNAAQGDNVYAEQTEASGRVLILFGNTILGAVPPLLSDIDISYGVTVGSLSNSSVVGDTFQYLDQLDIGGGTFLQLVGTSTTTASGGSDEQSIQQVKTTAPRLFAANQRAVRRDDYEGHILSFTGANAARAWGEFEEANQKGFADLTQMNRAYVTVIPNTLADGNLVIGTGNGALTNFTGTIATNLIPGSISISSDTANWQDFDGKGLLLSDSVSFDVVGSGTPDASENSGSASNAFDGNPASAWSSITTPTVFNPVRVSYDFGAGSEKVIKSLRIRSSDDGNLNQRGAVKQVIILGSNVASPDLSTRDDWTVLRGTTRLEEPGFNTFSRWIPVDDTSSTTAYRHVAIEILEIHGTTTTCKVSDIQVQDDTNDSTINYETGAFDLTYSSAPTGDITADYYNGNLSAAQKDDLLTFLDDLNHFTTLLEYRDSVAVLLDVDVTVYHLEGFDSQTILANVQTAIDNLFAVQADSIGKPLYLSDIYQAIQDVDGVDYSLLATPTTDKFVEIDQYIQLNNKTISVLPTDR